MTLPLLVLHLLPHSGIRYEVKACSGVCAVIGSRAELERLFLPPVLGRKSIYLNTPTISAPPTLSAREAKNIRPPQNWSPYQVHKLQSLVCQQLAQLDSGSPGRAGIGPRKVARSAGLAGFPCYQPTFTPRKTHSIADAPFQ